MDFNKLKDAASSAYKQYSQDKSKDSSGHGQNYNHSNSDYPPQGPYGNQGGYNQSSHGGPVGPNSYPSHDPYGQPQHGGYGQPQHGGYGQPQHGGYGQSQHDPYGQPQQSGYGQPQH
ncbi:hypothetical protein FBU59_002253, partial [Linderina macrospora]